MAHIGLSRAKHLLAVTKFLHQTGTRVEPLIERVKLPVACLENPELLLPTFRIREFREVAARKIGLPNIALEATKGLQLADLGDFGRSILRTTTLYRSLVEFCTLVNTETSSAAANVQQTRGVTWFSHDQLETKSEQWNSELYMLIWMLRTVRLSAPNWSPEHLYVSFKETPERRAAIESLGCECATFGARHTSFAIPQSMLAARLQIKKTQKRLHDGVDKQKMFATAPRRGIAESLRQVLRSYDQKPWGPINRAAETAGLTVRTLQRRLGEEGLTFSTFVEQARFDTASLLLETTDAALTDIADELGYSTQANFTRAFQRWAGVSPGEFRRQRASN